MQAPCVIKRGGVYSCRRPEGREGVWTFRVHCEGSSPLNKHIKPEQKATQQTLSNASYCTPCIVNVYLYQCKELSAEKLYERRGVNIIACVCEGIISCWVQTAVHPCFVFFNDAFLLYLLYISRRPLGAAPMVSMAHESSPPPPPSSAHLGLTPTRMDLHLENLFKLFWN